MKRIFSSLLAFLLLFSTACPAFAYQLSYKEQLYKLYHRQLYMTNIDIVENINWLEQALRANFANPLNALAKIQNKEQWEKYRALFTMHLELKLVELYSLWASKYFKFNAYFYNAPFKDQNLDSLEIAEKRLRFALVYWKQAKESAALAGKHRWITLFEVQNWEDELYRIQNNELDYEQIINKHLERLEKVRQDFQSMDASTY